jgi:hypothetical protein
MAEPDYENMLLIRRKSKQKKSNSPLKVPDSGTTGLTISEKVITNPRKSKKVVNYQEQDLRKSKSASLNDKNNNLVWVHIFEHCGFDLKHQSNFNISSSEIKDSKQTFKGKSQFEPRLLCKQDSKEERPFLFQENNLNIIAIEFGLYLLTRTSIYKDIFIPLNSKVQRIQKDRGCLLFDEGDSENTLIDEMRYSGIFEREEFLGEKIDYGPLMRGRHRVSFQMILNKENIDVKNVQIETDGCYVSKNKILLLECKKGTLKNSFNIRQLYYPYRYIYNVYGNKKEIIPIFICGHKNKINVWKFKFNNYLDMNSIELVQFYQYELY